mmetsp:Transcript_54594/g.132599  ORF Transcript_54594/g.132599 Transcript_54594/m.132599 type:complete len:94 (-) Transcript_54594:2295-2576(-)
MKQEMTPFQLSRSSRLSLAVVVLALIPELSRSSWWTRHLSNDLNHPNPNHHPITWKVQAYFENRNGQDRKNADGNDADDADDDEEEDEEAEEA